MSRTNMRPKQLLIQMVIGLFIGGGGVRLLLLVPLLYSFYDIVLSLTEGDIYIHAY